MQRLVGFLRHLPQPAFVKDLEGIYLYANPALLGRLGLEASQVEGQTDFELFPGAQAARWQAAELRLGTKRQTVVKIQKGQARTGLAALFGG